MKFELIEDINSSLENEYDELQSYMSSTVDKLKEATTTLENISKSYNGLKNLSKNNLAIFLVV